MDRDIHEPPYGRGRKFAEQEVTRKVEGLTSWWRLDGQCFEKETLDKEQLLTLANVKTLTLTPVDVGRDRASRGRSSPLA